VSQGRSSAWRRLALFAAALLGGAACANQGLPRGGPEDFSPPQILKITPENNTVIGKPGWVTIQFDEVVSETPKGARDLEELVFISPKSGAPRVDWDRKSIQIRPSKGWKSNTVYTVQLKAGLQDLYQNPLDSTIRVIFSTGVPIPDSRIKGVVFDWQEAKGLAGGVVEAVSQDTTIVYQVVADSAGRFELNNIPIGPYLLRAYGDRNNNKDLDPLEMWDSVRVTLTGVADAEFYAFARDTVGLRIAQVEPTDSNRVLKVTFDKPYALDQFFVPDGTQLVRLPDSVPLRARFIQTEPQRLLADSLAAKRKADSVAAEAAKKDSLPADQRARRDSIAAVRQADSVANAARQRERQQREAARAARAAGRPYTPPDTTPPPKMNRPRVYKVAFIALDTALTPGRTYRLTMTGVKSLNAIIKAPARNFTVPRAPVDSTKGDSTARGRDTTVRRDTTARDVSRRIR
jgi:hypothetical protein